LQKSGKGPIIIMGHSLGADAAIYMAEKMKTLAASVALIVAFGPTTNLVAPSNVAQVINYYTGTTLVTKGPGFRGSISNVNLNSAADINHLNIEKSNRFHANIISKIQTIVGGQRRASPSAAVQ
jgi:pimeloyl-ACP methyl ester carboxylesterase